MKTTTLTLLLGCAALSYCAAAAPAQAANPPNQGQRKAVTIAVLRQDFANPDKIYAPFMFWFWDEPLDPAKMAEMARVMGTQGFNPGYAHGVARRKPVR